MESSMPPLPSKKAVALDLLERTSLFVHLDPRRPGVIVPLAFAKQPQLVLQIGLNMAISIPDLEVGETGISCTLSFNRRPHFCRLPWSAIYALIGQEGGGMVWPEDVPPEVVAQQRSAARKEPAPRKPTLRALDGGAEATDASDSADRHVEHEEASPNARRAPSGKSDSARKQAGIRRVSSVPPRSATRPEADSPSEAGVDLETKLAAGEETAALETAALETERNGTSEPSASELASRQRSETVGPGKRERPPYLRLVR